MAQIGIIGAGLLGGTLARALAAVGHKVLIANSRSPKTLSDITSHDISAEWLPEVAHHSTLLFLTVPYRAIPSVAPRLTASSSSSTLFVDAGNYYPGRDGDLPGLDPTGPPPDSVWLSQQLHRPVIKAFNTIGYDSLQHRGLPPGSQNRIGLPIAGQRSENKDLIFRLVDTLGFDPVDGGELEDSWRQQPGSPLYVTDHPAATIREILDNTTESDRTKYRDNLQKFDELIAAGSEQIYSLRRQGHSLDGIIKRIDQEKIRIMDQVRRAQD